jgi:hypothetical protein
LRAAAAAFEEFLEETFEETDQVPDNVNTGEAPREVAGEAGGGLTLRRLVALRTQLDTLATRGLLAQVRDRARQPYGLSTNHTTTLAYQRAGGCGHAKVYLATQFIAVFVLGWVAGAGGVQCAAAGAAG